MVAHEELIEAVGNTAPGPNGLSAEILKILVQDVVCRDALRRILRDIMNFRIDESVRRRITRCRLVALPKPDGGTRPIAIGDTLLKLAGQRAFHRIRSYFGDLQSGCLAQGGGERVVHSVRADVEAGSYVLTIDQSNAFNTPLRTAAPSSGSSGPSSV